MKKECSGSSSLPGYIIILRYITRWAGQPVTFFRSIKVLWSEISLPGNNDYNTTGLVWAPFINWLLCKSSTKVEIRCTDSNHQDWLLVVVVL